MKQKIEITLADVSEFIVDCLHNTAPTQEEGYPLIRTPNIGKGRLILEGVFRVSEDTYNIWTRRATPQPNDLILAREATAGNVAIIKEGQSVCLGQRTVHIRPDVSKVDPDFLCYYLLTPESQGKLLANETGATSKHVNMKDIRKFPLSNIPELSVQRKIGSIISQYDDLIENNRRRIQILEEAARLLYREWFVRLRFPGHEHTKIVDGVPEGWQSVKLQDVANITMGQSPSSSYYNHDGIGLPFHQGVSDYGDRFPSNTTYCSKEFRIAEAGDILFSVRAPVGRINITLDKIVIGRGLASIRSKMNHQEFLFYCLKNLFFKDDLMGTGAIYAAITKKELTEYCLLYPSNVIIESFIEYVKPIDQMIISLHMSNTNQIKARDLLLPRLMNGVIPV